MLDYLAIFKKLNEKGIRYIVVGGIAVKLYGIPRMTCDIDLILDLEDENMKDFLQLLKGWGFKPKVPVDIMVFAKNGEQVRRSPLNSGLSGSIWETSCANGRTRMLLRCGINSGKGSK